jgi:hypothetical protein
MTKTSRHLPASGTRRKPSCVDPAEIRRVFQIPVSHLVALHKKNGYLGKTPPVLDLTYPFEDVVIWGVTAKILHHLLEVLILS